jgi:hypothetical protein
MESHWNLSLRHIARYVPVPSAKAVDKEGELPASLLLGTIVVRNLQRQAGLYIPLDFTPRPYPIYCGRQVAFAFGEDTWRCAPVYGLPMLGLNWALQDQKIVYKEITVWMQAGTTRVSTDGTW